MSEGSEVVFDLGQEDLGSRTVRSTLITIGAMVLQQGMRLGVMAVLARLLTPEDYGLLGMVFVFVTFVQVFANLGLTTATIQKEQVTQAQISIPAWMKRSNSRSRSVLRLCGVLI